jgi:hypothetical protein
VSKIKLYVEIMINVFEVRTHFWTVSFLYVWAHLTSNASCSLHGGFIQNTCSKNSNCAINGSSFIMMMS